MITEGIVNVFFIFIKEMIKLLPESFFKMPEWVVSFSKLIKTVLYFFPAEIWLVLIGNIIFWIVTENAWAIIEWVYKKIPGVD